MFQYYIIFFDKISKNVVELISTGNSIQLIFNVILMEICYLFIRSPVEMNPANFVLP